ncbi:MAG: VanW family protein [Clostridia bacterium]|nr:VanW family protein [Clostridia bacterium]
MEENRQEDVITEDALDSGEKTEKLKKCLLILAIVLGVIFSVIAVLALITLSYDKIYSGISVNGTFVGGMSKQEAEQVLEEKYANVSDINLIVYCDDERIAFTGKDIAAKFDSQKAVETAYQTGRDGGFFEKIANGLRYRLMDNDIEVLAECDRLKVDSQISKLTKDIKKPVIQPEYVREGDKLLVKTGVSGRMVDEDQIRNDILKNLTYLKEEIILSQSEVISPEKIDVEEIRSMIKQKVQNAEYINDTGTFVDQIIGVDIKNVEEAKKIAESVDEEGMQFSIPLLITLPEVTTEQVLQQLFVDELSSFTTYFNVNEKERTENVTLSANFINDVILMPGQEFSYNTTVGERSVERGFKTAKVYSQGQVVDGLGGGICQTSSTLYNAVVKADLEVLERRNHSLPVSYVKLGTDATVVYGTTDFRFKNNQQYPIKITAKISGGSLTVKILGINTHPERTVEFRTETIAVLPYSVKEIVDENLTTGQRVVIQSGKKGYKVKSYRVTKENGEVVSEKLISTDTYSPVAEIAKVGPSI